ncbi:MAG TPA: hypothetical protein VH594_26150 [Trebonia sp.]|jgi:hypothetical protein
MFAGIAILVATKGRQGAATQPSTLEPAPSAAAAEEFLETEAAV